MNATLQWENDYYFKCINGNQISYTDSPESHKAPTPKELLLNAMMGCTAIDTLSILNKMRLTWEKFQVDITASKNQDHPIHFKQAKLIFSVVGDLPEEKLIKAVTYSLTKYCGVNYMVTKSAEVKFEIVLNNLNIHSGISKFEDPLN